MCKAIDRLTSLNAQSQFYHGFFALLMNDGFKLYEIPFN